MTRNWMFWFWERTVRFQRLAG